MNLCHSTAGKRLSALSLSIIFLLNLSLTGCSSISSETSSNKKASLSFEEFCNTLFCSEVSSNTINLHFTLSNPESYGITDPPITLGEISHSASDKTNADIENTLASLEQFQYETLSTSDQLTYDILSDYLNHELSGTEYYLYEEYLTQLPASNRSYRFYTRNTGFMTRRM